MPLIQPASVLLRPQSRWNSGSSAEKLEKPSRTNVQPRPMMAQRFPGERGFAATPRLTQPGWADRTIRCCARYGLHRASSDVDRMAFDRERGLLDRLVQRRMGV